MSNRLFSACVVASTVAEPGVDAEAAAFADVPANRTFQNSDRVTTYVFHAKSDGHEAVVGDLHDRSVVRAALSGGDMQVVFVAPNRPYSVVGLLRPASYPAQSGASQPQAPPEKP